VAFFVGSMTGGIDNPARPKILLFYLKRPFWGTQLVVTKVPPGLRTLAADLKPAIRSSKRKMPKKEQTESKEASSKRTLICYWLLLDDVSRILKMRISMFVNPILFYRRINVQIYFKKGSTKSF
jgi:hypothetical protein